MPLSSAVGRHVAHESLQRDLGHNRVGRAGALAADYEDGGDATGTRWPAARQAVDTPTAVNASRSGSTLYWVRCKRG